MTSSAQQVGILIVDKEEGMSSAAVVAKAKRLLGAKKIGHTGTLDPMATGVLPLCIGEATKIAGYLLAEDKEYTGEIQLGSETDTHDALGVHISGDPEAAKQVGAEELARAVEKLRAQREQIPPMYSALKQDGQRLYAMARQGKSVVRPPRPIVVHRFDCQLVEGSEALLRFSAWVSKGTYIRSMARDLGRELGCGAHLRSLRRTRSGDFSIKDACRLDSQEQIPALLPIHKALGSMRQVTVKDTQIGAVADGKRLQWAEITEEAPAEGLVALMHPQSGGLLALAHLDESEEYDGDPATKRLRYRRVFNYALTPPSS